MEENRDKDTTSIDVEMYKYIYIETSKKWTETRQVNIFVTELKIQIF